MCGYIVIYYGFLEATLYVQYNKLSDKVRQCHMQEKDLSVNSWNNLPSNL